MVHRYPAAIKAFYMKPDPERAELALGVDVLAPEGYGEIIGGGERLADLDLLLAAHQGAQPAAGSVRVVPRPAALRHRAARRLRHGHRARRRWICGLEHVRETIPYPRMLYRLYP